MRAKSIKLNKEILVKMVLTTFQLYDTNKDG
jgi:hypothetical protein